MLAAFCSWWLARLSELLPDWLRPASSTAPDSLLVSPRGALDQFSGVSIAVRRAGRAAPLGDFPAAAGRFGPLPGAAGKPVVLRLDSRDVLEKTLTLPIAAQATLDQVLAFEMDRETPFRAEELYWTYRVIKIDRPHQQLAVRLALLPKAKIAALLGALAASGTAPHRGEISDGGDDVLFLPLDGHGAPPPIGSRRLVQATAACCLLLALGAVAIPFIRQAAALSALDSEIHNARATAAQAEALRRDIDRLSHNAALIEGEQGKTGRPLATLAEVTRLLPDDTFLTDLTLRRRKLTISGRSAGAARLIAALAADRDFRNPAFSAPVTRIEAKHVEVFTIAADVEVKP